MRTVGWNILILFLAYFASANVPKKCGPPPEYPHTRLNQRFAGKQSFSSGQKVWYKCAEDFLPYNGNKIVQCLDGKWSRLSLECEKKSCGNAGDLPNGQFEYGESTYIGEKVHAKCNEGYTLKGPGYMICKNTGWTGDFPTCEVGESTCFAPAVSNSVSSATVPSEYRVGESMSFTCSRGFRLEGPQQITCGKGGLWQPDPPQCLRSHTTTQAPTTGREKTVLQDKTTAPTTTARGCGAPLTTRESNANLADKYLMMKSFASGYRVHYVCDVGHIQAGGSRYRTCVDGKWTPLLLRCQRKPCGSAGEIFNGQFIYTGDEFGDTATAVCDRGYRLVGRGTRNCLSKGWDGRVPVCEAVDCDEPPVVENAVMEGNQESPYTYGNLVYYRCKAGTLMGSAEVWCTENGTWSAPPACKQISCRSPAVHDGFWAGAYRDLYQYRDTIAIECRTGYKTTGYNIISCGLDGRWHPEPPKCARMSPRTRGRG